jgi:hypothetical protein
MKHGWIVFDEFLFMAPKVFEALLPTFATGAAGTLISSLSPEDNNPIMAILYSKYRDGSNVFEVINWIQVKKIIYYYLDYHVVVSILQ